MSLCHSRAGSRVHGKVVVDESAVLFSEASTTSEFPPPETDLTLPLVSWRRVSDNKRHSGILTQRDAQRCLRVCVPRAGSFRQVVSIVLSSSALPCDNLLRAGVYDAFSQATERARRGRNGNCDEAAVERLYLLLIRFCRDPSERNADFLSFVFESAIDREPNEAARFLWVCGRYAVPAGEEPGLVG